MPLMSPAAETRTVLEKVSWTTYEALLRELGPCRGRLAYEEGVLEIMSPSPLHEKLKGVIGCLLEAFASVRGINMSTLGSVTMRRELLQRGIEPDECYYIQNEPLIREKEDLDFGSDPPPDLAIEIEITRSALNRLGIYGALRVPEVWRHDGAVLSIYHLQTDGSYAQAKSSRVLPGLPVEELASRIGRHREMSMIALADDFREWLRRQPLP